MERTQFGELNSSGFRSQAALGSGSGGWKSKIMMSAGLVSGETSLLGLQMAVFLPHPQHSLSLCVCPPGVSSSSYKDARSIRSGLHPNDLI
uniref:Uncharacterized protein n=1 Tax=Mustela putorius furo TaxID=9669 RepID=M3YJG7_MUSPF